MMILPFKEQFIQSILTGTKIHTIREDKKKRWLANKKIHFATGVRTKNYNCFMEGTCKLVQCIVIYRKSEIIYINNRALRRSEIKLLAKNDGFNTVAEFWQFFNESFMGVIIHWTELRY